MLYRGYFLAIDDHHLRSLRSARGDPARRALVAQFEESIDDAQGTDKAWYLLFNCFNNSRSDDRVNDIPAADLTVLDLVFIGGTRLHRADFYVINLVAREQVPVVAKALATITPETLEQRYKNLNQNWFCAGDYTGTEAQYRYCLSWLNRIAAFFVSQRTRHKHVLFTSQYQ
jgi:hypothetical protein